MSEDEQESASIPRAARRVDWAARALVAAALDLQAIGARGAGNAIADEAGRLEGLAGEVRELKVT
jgi:hypothetical protein